MYSGPATRNVSSTIVEPHLTCGFGKGEPERSVGSAIIANLGKSIKSELELVVVEILAEHVKSDSVRRWWR